MDTLEALRLFVSIADTGNLSAAARYHSVATSTVTLGLQQLEERVGAHLITRSTRSLKFTHEGEQLLGSARRLLASWDNAVESVHQDGPLSGPIRMTATNDFGRRRLLPLLDQFMALHPDVQISLQLGDGVLDMIEHNLDIALRNGPLTDSSLRSKPLIRSHRVVCAAPDYWRRHGKPVHPEQLAEHNCLVLQRPGAPFSNWPFVIEGKAVSVHVSGNRAANDSAVLRYWALHGYGVMIKNEWEIRHEIERGLLETALDEFISPHVDLYAVTTSGTSNRRVSTLVDFLVQKLG